MGILDKIQNLIPKPKSKGLTMDKSTAAFLDVPNLLRGEGISIEEGTNVLKEHLPLIERTCLSIWGVLPQTRYASSLATIPAELHQLLQDYGYQVDIAEATVSDTMLIEHASKRDDYLLSRQVKRRVQEGLRDILIISGDRDFEKLASQLAVFGPKFHFVQRQKMSEQRNTKLQRYTHLKSFAAKLDPALESAFQIEPKRAQNNTKACPRLVLKHGGRLVKELELFHKFKIGRMSGRAGKVDLCLSTYDQERDYSRQLASIVQLGNTWVLCRKNQDPHKVERQPISFIPVSGESIKMSSGENIVLSAGDCFSFDLCEISMTFQAE